MKQHNLNANEALDIARKYGGTGAKGSVLDKFRNSTISAQSKVQVGGLGRSGGFVTGAYTTTTTPAGVQRREAPALSGGMGGGGGGGF